MARPVNKLTARGVAALKAPGRYGDGAGLYLHVDAGGSKRWVFVYQWRKKRREMGLGSVNSVPLGTARELAATARQNVALGKNPMEERRRASSAETPTFGEMTAALIESLKPEWKNAKHAWQWETSLSGYAGALTDRPVDQVDTDDVLEVLKPIWEKVPETAARLRGRIERVLDAARAKGHIAPPWENPARWRGHLALLLPKRRRLTRGHHPALPYAELPAFIAELRDRPAVSAACLEFTILSATRTGEMIGAQWSEIDLLATVWTIPDARTKTGKELRVPLTTRHLAILEEMEKLRVKKSPWVFPGQRQGTPLSNMAMENLLERMGRTDITVHGFRSTFRDWAGDCTTFAKDLVEEALGHAVANQVERAYRRSDALLKRRKLMEAWAGFCARPAGGKVISFQRAGNVPA